MGVQTLISLRRHRPWLGDVLLAGLLVWIVLRLQQLGLVFRHAPLIGVIVVAVMLRRYRPVAVLAGVTAVLLGTIMFKAVAGGLVLVIGVLTYSAALYSPKRRPWLYAGTVLLAIMVVGLVVDWRTWLRLETLGVFAWIIGGAGVGDSIRMRRAYIAEVTERARQAEQTREEEARRRVIDERLRIARELHDVVAHHIAVIGVHAGAASHVLRHDPEQVWPVLDRIREASDTVLTEIQSVIGLLRDPGEVEGTEPVPGLERLPDLLAGLAANGFHVARLDRGPARPLPAVADLAAYRIVQEALTNAHRYGDGSAALSVEYGADAVTIEVSNRIGGRRPGRPGSGFGLIGMRERATSAHGTITAGPGGDGFFRVRAVLPCERPETTPTQEPTHP